MRHERSKPPQPRYGLSPLARTMARIRPMGDHNRADRRKTGAETARFRASGGTGARLRRRDFPPPAPGWNATAAQVARARLGRRGRARHGRAGRTLWPSSDISTTERSPGARSGSLLRRGYGQRRVRAGARRSGDQRGDARKLRPGEAAKRAGRRWRWRARRRLRPVRPAAPPTALREKQIAAMLRAGHPLDSARQIVDAASAGRAEQWAAEADDEEELTRCAGPKVWVCRLPSPRCSSAPPAPRRRGARADASRRGAGITRSPGLTVIPADDDARTARLTCSASRWPRTWNSSRKG